MSLKKRMASFGYALKGVADLFRNEPNARIHLAAAAVAIGAGVYFQVSRTEWIALALSISIVFGMEAMNTAVERLTDLASPDFHPLAGKAKDVAAAAVLLVALGAVVVGAIIFLPKIGSLLFG